GATQANPRGGNHDQGKDNVLQPKPALEEEISHEASHSQKARQLQSSPPLAQIPSTREGTLPPPLAGEGGGGGSKTQQQRRDQQDPHGIARPPDGPCRPEVCGRNGRSDDEH